jgi:hypothetical protein
MTTFRAPTLPVLPYRKPTQGRDYWVFDDVLPDPAAVRDRAIARTDWVHPTEGEAWPGMRVAPGLEAAELAHVEGLVRNATGMSTLWVGTAPDGAHLNHNVIQVVGVDECGVKPHTDARSVCRFAAVLYLNPAVPEGCGTSFFRQRLRGGQLGGNVVMPPHDNLVQALGTRYVPADSFVEDVRVAHRCNRLLLYRANMLHSATAYHGHSLEEKRMAAVFFWMAK